MLMELAEESRTPFPCSKPSRSTWAKMRFTPVWASSKFPRTAQTQTLSPSWVAIWACWTGLTPPWG